MNFFCNVTNLVPVLNRIIHCRKYFIYEFCQQLNTLQQLQHVASYSFIHNAISSGRVHIHALWFDIYTGDIYYFSRSQKRFVEISETTAEYLLNEIQEYFT